MHIAFDVLILTQVTLYRQRQSLNVCAVCARKRFRLLLVLFKYLRCA